MRRGTLFVSTYVRLVEVHFIIFDVLVVVGAYDLYICCAAAVVIVSSL